MVEYGTRMRRERDEALEKVDQLQRQKDEALRTLAAVLWEAEGALTVSKRAQEELPDFEVSWISLPNGDLLLAVNER